MQTRLVDGLWYVHPDDHKEALDQLRCPDCGCATPQEASASECGCDAPVCAVTVTSTLAKDYATLYACCMRLADADKDLARAVNASSAPWIIESARVAMDDAKQEILAFLARGQQVQA